VLGSSLHRQLLIAYGDLLIEFWHTHDTRENHLHGSRCFDYRMDDLSGSVFLLSYNPYIKDDTRMSLRM
jgi:hypothetical protein